MLTQHFIVEGKYLGTATRQNLMRHAELQEPLSYAWFCPLCGDVWARASVEGGTRTPAWEVIHAPCRKHETHLLAVPGALTLSWEPEFNAILPDEVLQWELQRHIDYLEKKL